MGHEVFVPFSADTVRQALADPARVARCIPGFQRDAEGSGESPDALTGRLRLRVGNSTITYRGRLHIKGQDGGGLALEGEGTEARGSGSVKLALTVRLSAADGGSALEFTGTVHKEGRLADAGEKTAATAGRRLLDRFAAELAADLESAPIGTGGIVAPPSPPASSATAGEEEGALPESDVPESGLPEDSGMADRVFPDPDDDNQRVIPGIPSPDNPESREQAGAPDRSPGRAETGDEQHEAAGDMEEPEAMGEPEEPEAGPVFEVQVPPPSLEPLSGLGDELESEPPAEAAHARRTMIGRSAEEVDHAPPRGRYAPVPVPETVSSTTTLRWAAPAAAVIFASAVVVGRILRRRR